MRVNPCLSQKDKHGLSYHEKYTTVKVTYVSSQLNNEMGQLKATPKATYEKIGIFLDTSNSNQFTFTMETEICALS